MSQDAATVVDGKFEVQSRLAQLGVTRDELLGAIHAGLVDMEGCTELDPITLPGTIIWGRAIRRLRELKVVQGWRPENRQNVPLTVDPNAGIALTVSSGVGVGRPDRTPRNKNPKGTATGRCVRVNHLTLFPEHESIRLVPSPSDLETWLLLVEVESRLEADNVWAELSLPLRVDQAGYITDWDERILLGSVGLDDEPATSGEDPGSDLDDELDIPVSLR